MCSGSNVIAVTIQRIWTDDGLHAHWVLSDAEPGLLRRTSGHRRLTLCVHLRYFHGPGAAAPACHALLPAALRPAAVAAGHRRPVHLRDPLQRAPVRVHHRPAQLPGKQPGASVAADAQLHLGAAADAAFGADTAAGTAWSGRWRHVLRHDPKGAGKVIDAMRHLLRKGEGPTTHEGNWRSSAATAAACATRTPRRRAAPSVPDPWNPRTGFP